jgi:hypothetical protein
VTGEGVEAHSVGPVNARRERHRRSGSGVEVPRVPGSVLDILSASISAYGGGTSAPMSDPA